MDESDSPPKTPLDLKNYNKHESMINIINSENNTFRNDEKDNNKTLEKTPNKINENKEHNKKDLFGDVSDLGFQNIRDNKKKDTTNTQNSQNNNISVQDINNINTDPSTLKMSNSRRTRIFVFFLLANLFLNYDTGVIPASLLEIVKEIDLDFKEQALIGSLVYLGLSFASLFVSLIFTKYGPAKVCATVLILNTFCCFIFSFSKLKYVLFLTRFLMGVTEAFIVIYGPVWVNNYSPPEHSAMWMGILHSCSAFGVIFGYLVAGITINFFSQYLTWRFAIQVQGVAQIPIAIYFWFENENFINVDGGVVNEQNEEDLNETINDNNLESHKTPIKSSERKENNQKSATVKSLHDINVNSNSIRSKKNNERKINSEHNIQFNNNANNNGLNISSNTNALNRSLSKKHTSNFKRTTTRFDTIETSNLGKYCSQAKVVICNLLYICVTLGLCSMFFIVTGIQFWMTSYLIDILGNNPVTVVILFSTVSITAPLAGVIIGGTFADKYGGYKGKNTLKALKLCCAFGVVAFVFAFPLGFLTNLVYIVVLLWAFLFFGAAIIPVGTGIMVSSVRRDCQATSSSISQLIFNFFGYFMSPILTGFIMDGFIDKHEGYKWGMRLIFWWAIFAVIFMGLAWIVAYNKHKSGNKDEHDLLDDEMNQNMGDLLKLEIMRRMAQNV